MVTFVTGNNAVHPVMPYFMYNSFFQFFSRIAHLQKRNSGIFHTTYVFTTITKYRTYYTIRIFTQFIRIKMHPVLYILQTVFPYFLIPWIIVGKCINSMRIQLNSIVLYQEQFGSKPGKIVCVIELIS